MYRVLAAKAAPDGVSWGQMAGETVLEFATTPGLDVEGQYVYASAMNHACLADLLVSTVRKPQDLPWLVPENLKGWTSSCMMSPTGDKLRRVVIVSGWSEERHISECRSWYTLGEMAFYDLPMQLVVLVVGQQRNGRRHSHWTKALKHTIGHTHIRFRRRVGNTSGGFKDSWTEIWREDHEEISRELWLNAMLKDDVMRDLCFHVEMPPLPKYQRQYFQDLAARRMEVILGLKEKPPLQLSTCDWPIPCPFLKVCHSIPEKEPSVSQGFVEISLRKPPLQADSCIATGT